MCFYFYFSPPQLVLFSFIPLAFALFSPHGRESVKRTQCINTAFTVRQSMTLSPINIYLLLWQLLSSTPSKARGYICDKAIKSAAKFENIQSSWLRFAVVSFRVPVCWLTRVTFRCSVFFGRFLFKVVFGLEKVKYVLCFKLDLSRKCLNTIKEAALLNNYIFLLGVEINIRT